MAIQKLIFFALFAILFVATIVECDSSDEQKFAVELTSENFDEEIGKNNHFVMFFAPWCGHCKRLHPIWESLAEILNVQDEPKVIIATVDCTEQKSVCKDNEITGYPAMRLFKLGEETPIKYKGTRSMPAITEFINSQLNSDEESEIADDDDGISELPVAGKLVELTEENFAKHVSSGNHFVKFYAPWCSHCQRLAPTWEDLSKSLENDKSVSIGKIDCTLYRSICQDFDVKGYPTLLWIEDGKKIEKFAGTRDQESLKAYVEKMLGTGGAMFSPPPIDEKKPEVDKLQVLQLTGDDFQKTVADGVTFVKFYAPWCGHCQKLSPTWDQLAEKLHTGSNDIKIAKVDCTAAENKNLCVDEQVEGYPTLFAYKNGERQSEYDGSRSLPELQHYINKIVGHDEL